MRFIRLVFIFIICAMTSIQAFSSEKQSILIFVSFSMPKASLKAWIHDTQKIHAPIIIRGLVNNSFKDTQKAIFDLIKEDHSLGGMQIDPLSFKKFNIEKVPAVVLTRGQDFDVIYGNATLDYALKKLHEAKHD